MYLLLADPHFDDKPENEYRWHIFEEIVTERPSHVYILGDLCHKKDRHSAVLVNRLMDELRALTRRGMEVTILCGNHDEPKKGPPYWSFLNDIPNVHFITQPTADGYLLLLPHSIDPITEWAGIDFSLYRCIFMHQPVKGMDIGSGRLIELDNVPAFPSGMPVYSGDAHYPQHVRGVEYIGTPHPINYGEHHLYRMVVLDENYGWLRQVTMHPISKHTLSVRSVQELNDLYVRDGDQAKIEFVLPASRVDQWPVERSLIAEWARANGITVAVTKATIETSPTQQEPVNGFMDPIEVLVNFSEAEGIEEALLITGYLLLEEALAEGLHA
jgi:UDP-2,3-diacylglucosamine pyrophosphatase LpxH